LALEGHDRKSDHVRLNVAHQLYYRLPHALLDKDQIRNRHAMTRINVSGQRSQGAVRHPDDDGGHMLE
jgi:hypothetical protein